MITVNDKVFTLETRNTSYIFSVMETGQLEHMYYGHKIHPLNGAAIKEKHAFAPGNTIAYTNDHGEFTLEDMPLEMSGYGKGDIREPFIELVAADGSSSTDFVYESHEITTGRVPLETLPSSYDEKGDSMHLCVVMKDRNNGYTLELHYHVFEECDVITRSSVFINTSDAPVDLKRLMSLQLDLQGAGKKVTTFHGAWTKEMNKTDCVINGGKFVNSSYTGSSSSRSNPLFIVADEKADENHGLVLGVNLVYSSNHYSAIDVSAFGKSRVVSGINPQNFSFKLEPGDRFEAPEAVMTHAHGYANMSLNFQHFVREHITRGEWKYKERPVLLNSWEANYFDIDEGKLIKLAKAGKDIGVELFVMDDGWFGKRNDDKTSLGDWDVNTKKLPHGLDGLAKKINDLGLDFGIWVEPEMINVDSDLYRAHPDWAIDIPGKDHSEGRNQRILDLCNPEVVDYMIDKMSAVFSSANISYVKWDMNRIFSDYYSKYLPKERQQEVAHRYIMGFYRMLKTLTEKFPHILFEGCASGGNRFDLGVLCYYPQIWGSDNTDAVSRLFIQDGYSYGYPMSCVSAHVSSCPNHQTLRTTPLESRFAVASFGVLGYEINLCDAKAEDIAEMKQQIEIYKKYRKTMQYGDFYRSMAGNVYEWTVVAPDKSEAVGMIMQREVQPNNMYLEFHARGLDNDATYHFTGRSLKYNVKNFGDLINTAAPFHVKQDSVMHDIIAKFVKMDGEQEDCMVTGDTLNSCGVKLHQGYVGTGYSDQCRYFPDFGARLYFMEKQ